MLDQLHKNPNKDGKDQYTFFESLEVLLTRLSSKKIVNYSWYSLIIAFFFCLILLPTIYVLGVVIVDLPNTIDYIVTSGYLNDINEAIFNSVVVSIGVSIIDLIFGIPLAWLIVRGRISPRLKHILNTLVELPLAVPTAGLGLSVAMFWGVTPSISNTPPFSPSFVHAVIPILILFHFTTTFPYVVRALAAILEEIDIYLEIAARTCGASSFTAARTVTLPLFRSGVATALVLSLAKSLSDTGGVMAVLKATEISAYTGTVLIGTWKGLLQENTNLLPALAFLSALMIVIAITLLGVSRFITKKIRFPIKKVWSKQEKTLSGSTTVKARDGTTIIFLVLFVLVPSFFIFLFLITGFPGTGNINWQQFFSSIAFSVLVAAIATMLNVILGVPLAIFIERRQNILSRILNVLVDVPYVVPSAALGFSVGLFWADYGGIISNELFFVIMAHCSMTFPFIVRNVVGALEGLDLSYEETARTLGAKPFQIFYIITLPIIKFSIIAGVIMSFTRSIGETGATLAVSPKSITAPVYIVKVLIANGNYFEAALAIVILICITSALIFILRISLGHKKTRRV